MLTMEGLGHAGQRRFGPEDDPLRWHVMIDPIDGTRGLMYDKRAAWFLATAAPALASAPSLASATAAAMVELPTSKQGWADDFMADEAGALIGRRVDLASGRALPLPVGPSSASRLEHGFAHVVSFFPGIHRLAADLTETIAAATTRALPGQAVLFNDQYISTGGQIVELMSGRDRFCCDLRPLFQDILRRQGMTPASAGLECHPYDMAGLLLARRAGVIVTDGFGRDLDAPFDVISGVHWCGYANAAIQSLVAPVVRDWLAQHGVAP